jgi:hypothetical protein
VAARRQVGKRRWLMIVILDFSWRDFRPFERADASVGDLLYLAQQHSPDLYLFHDTAVRSSALIIPDQLIRVVEEFGMPRDESAIDSGLLTILRKDQLTVSSREPARFVTLVAEEKEAHAVIVTDPYRQDIPIGLFFPGVLQERLHDTSLVRESSLVPAIKERMDEGDIVGAITAVEDKYDEFHSESLNFRRPNPYVCAGDEGSHISSKCPCNLHPDASCKMRAVVSR